MPRRPDALALSAVPACCSEEDAATVLARATEILLRIDQRMKMAAVKSVSQAHGALRASSAESAALSTLAQELPSREENRAA